MLGCICVFVCVHLKDTVACRWFSLAEQFLEDEITEFIHILPAFLLLSQNPTEVMATLNPAPPFGTWALLKVTGDHLPNLGLSDTYSCWPSWSCSGRPSRQCLSVCSHFRREVLSPGPLSKAGVTCSVFTAHIVTYLNLDVIPSKTKVKPGSAWLNTFDPKPEAGRCLQ